MLGSMVGYMMQSSIQHDPFLNISSQETMSVMEICKSDTVTAERLRDRLATHPQEASEKDNDGYTPLHMLCRYNNNLDNPQIVELVLNAHPAAASEKNNNGDTPLDYLNKHNNGATDEMKGMLVSAHKGNYSVFRDKQI